MDFSPFLNQLRQTQWFWIVAVALGLVAVLAFLIWLIFRIRAWYWEDEDPAALDHEMLSRFGVLHREGDLSEEEYRLIKSRLVERLNQPEKK